MSDIKTNYMGIPLDNPVIAGASSFTRNLDSIKKIEDAGAGAIVVSSLFEEQIKLEQYAFDKNIHQYDDWHAEMTTIFPDIDHAGAEEHLKWVRKTKEEVDIPVIASLNAKYKKSWAAYAKQLEETGVDGLELNFYSNPEDFNTDALAVESEQEAIVSEIVKNARIPVSVKLSPFYTNPLNLVRKLDNAGVNGVVLFNRFFQPLFDVEKEQDKRNYNLSGENDHRLPLRFTGLLYKNVEASLCASNGILTGDNAIEAILAGADTVQIVSALYKQGFDAIKTIKERLTSWMEQKGYGSINEFQGKLSRLNNPDPWSYKRAQYVRVLMQSEKYIDNTTLI